MPEYATGTVHHDTVLDDGTVVHHHQGFEAGRLVEWAEDDEPGPVGAGAARRSVPAVPVVVAVASPDSESVFVRIGDERLALPPIDDFTTPDFDALEDDSRRDGVPPLRVDCTRRSGPSTATSATRTASGGAELVGDWPERREGERADDAPELHIAMTWRNYLRMRTGELDRARGASRTAAWSTPDGRCCCCSTA